MPRKKETIKSIRKKFDSLGDTPEITKLKWCVRNFLRLLLDPKKTKINSNNHGFYGNKDRPLTGLRTLRNFEMYGDIQNFEEVLDCLSKNKVPEKLVFDDGMHNSCFTCGRYVYYVVTKNHIQVAEPCSAPKGFRVITTLNVPSGKIVVNDSLREALTNEELVSSKLNGDGLVGNNNVTLAAAKFGLAHGFVGNSCPGVYRTKSGMYAIANPPYSEEWDDIDMPNWERVGGVCTDLWWYSIMDADDYVKRTGIEDAKLRKQDTIEVEPGKYKFSYYYSSKTMRDNENTRYGDTNTPRPLIYATFRRVGIVDQQIEAKQIII